VKVTYGAIVQRASGRFGGTVHSNWKGIDVVRRFAAPSNPNTSAQQQVRALFQNLTKAYQMAPAYHSAAWTAYATGKKALARNLFIGASAGDMKGLTDWADFQPFPAMSGAVPPTAYVPVGGVGQITVTVTAAAAPTGWTLSRAITGCIVNGDPSAGLTFAECKITEADDATAPYTGGSLTGLAAGDYWTWAALLYTAPDGGDRYSAALVNAVAITVT
jgi:hypothetical protein